jgi:hypothetical protein
MLYTLDVINARKDKKITIGAHILDDCDTDTYGLEMALDFIKGKNNIAIHLSSSAFHFVTVLISFVVLL